MLESENKATTLDEWIVGPDTGTSSKTLWAFFKGLKWQPNFDIPYDCDDFQRCYKVVSLVPDGVNKLQTITAWFPKWKPFAEAWSELASIWKKIAWDWSPKTTQERRSLNRRLSELRKFADDAMVDAGWLVFDERTDSYQKWHLGPNHP